MPNVQPAQRYATIERTRYVLCRVWHRIAGVCAGSIGVVVWMRGQLVSLTPAATVSPAYNYSVEPADPTKPYLTAGVAGCDGQVHHRQPAATECAGAHEA